MESVVENGKIYEFADFRLIPGEELLLRNGEQIPLNSKSFRVLSMLVERHGHLVPKLEIIDSIWKDLFVEEGSLTKAIWAVRHALDDTSKEGFIQTVPKRGYRFVHPVSVVTNSSGAYRVSDLTGIDDVSDLTGIDDDSRKAAHGPGKPTTNGFSGEIAVNSVAAETSQRNLAGIAENNLVSSRRSRTSFTALMAYAGIALVFLAGFVLYTAVNWRNFAKTNGPPDRGTKNEEAYRLYRQAENLSARRNRENMPTAMDDLNRAVSLDPNFARAWAAKAHLHRYLAEYPGGDQGEQYKRSMEALGKALAIDPNLSEAHSALCLNKLRYEYDSVGAERACIRAVELDPNSSVSHKAYATFLFSKGRFDQAVAEIKQALEIQPLALENQQTYALALYYSRRYEEEEIQWKSLIESNPPHGYLYIRLFISLKQQGKEDEAFDYLLKKLTMDHVENQIIERFRTAYATMGWRGVTIERIKHPEIEPFTGPFDVACLYATVGDKDKAFEHLEKAYLQRSYRMAVLQVEPQLDAIRDDPRFDELVRQMESK